MSKLGSPKHQVAQALGKLYKHSGQRQDKARGIAHRYIYDTDTLHAYIADGTQFANWCRDRWDIRDIRRLQARHARLFLDDLAAREQAGGTLERKRAAIRKLSFALHGEAWANLGSAWPSDPRPERAYQRDDAVQRSQPAGPYR
ncbi:MAG: site-specific integrase [Chloroflexi bacterium]|nr:site-specific integrase [Chloroflexota bacterium]MBU1748379.1 site-specific integrase [Chloroflexota bacterium]